MYKILITTLVLLFGVINYAHADITTGLQGRWSFDEGTGTLAADSTVNGYDAKIVNATWSAGQIGSGSITFDGVNDYATSTNIGGGYSAITISMWIKPSRVTGTYGILENGTTYTGNSFYVFLIDGKPEFEIYASNYDAFRTTSAITQDVWTHVTCVWAVNTRTKVYINGSLVAGLNTGTQQSASLKTGNTAQYFGGRPAAPIDFDFGGSLDEVRIYNRAFSADDITELYNYTGGATAEPHQYFSIKLLKQFAIKAGRLFSIK